MVNQTAQSRITELKVEHKIDGAAVSVEYRNGQLVQAISRGNGLVGDDITHNAQTFHGLPHRIDLSISMLIRGEAYMLFEDLVDLNKSRLASVQLQIPFKVRVRGQIHERTGYRVTYPVWNQVQLPITLLVRERIADEIAIRLSSELYCDSCYAYYPPRK